MDSNPNTMTDNVIFHTKCEFVTIVPCTKDRNTRDACFVGCGHKTRKTQWSTEPLIPVSMIHVGSMLDHRRKRLPNIETKCVLTYGIAGILLCSVYNAENGVPANRTRANHAQTTPEVNLKTELTIL